jgi:hypothetical protein
MKWWGAILLFIAALQPCAGQSILLDIIHADSLDVKYHKLFEHPSRYHFQVIYTEINRDSNNVAHFKKHYLYTPSQNYYYPASLVKLPLVALALEKIDSLNKIYGITKDTRLKIDSAHKCQTTELYDSTSETKYPSIAQYIKRMLLVSDNYAYSRIYEFLTPRYINRRLHELGYKEAEINQRFNVGCDSTDNRYTNPFTFLANDTTVLYRQPADSNMEPIGNMAKHTVLGKGWIEGKKIKPARDFRNRNYMPFKNENDILLSLIFPTDFPPAKRFKLNKEDYRFLHTYMGMLPRESDYPHYKQCDYPDNLKKYIYFGTSDTINNRTIRSLNIVGRAYGFLADCTYMMDTVSHAEFGLSVLLYLNEKDLLNDGKYQYNEIGLPFMSDLGHAIMEYEQKRERKYKPDLSKFTDLWNKEK